MKIKSVNLDELEEYLARIEGPDKYLVSSDNAFTCKARLLQAVRRCQSGAERGFIIKNGKKYYHSNLAICGEKSGCNFLDSEIFEYAKNRVANKKPNETIAEDRLFNNFLSSQPMAFNLFYPLMQIVKSEAGQKRLAVVISQLLDKENRLHIDRITEVGIEYIPDDIAKCLNDKTAMDAYFRYTTKDGKKGIIAIETKYTDKLGENQASDPTLAIQTATTRADIPNLFTIEGKKKIEDREIQLSQVYRNFLLTETVRLNEGLSDSLSVVIAPQGNKCNKKEESQLKDILKLEYKYKFQVITLEDFVQAIINEFPAETIFEKFRHRYLDFSL